MDKWDETTSAHAIWATAITLILGFIMFGIINSGILDHDFDVRCMASGNSVKYITLQGSDYAKKECR